MSDEQQRNEAVFARARELIIEAHAKFPDRQDEVEKALAFKCAVLENKVSEMSLDASCSAEDDAGGVLTL